MNERSRAGRRKKWKPASRDWVDVFHAISVGLGEPRRMFGYPCAFVNGNMFAGLFQTGLFVRLSEPERKEFLCLKGATPFEPLPGRVMREYVTAPAEMVNDPKAAARWVSKAYAYAASLPPKVRKAKTGSANGRARARRRPTMPG